ncbi:MAG TPA: magnesium transporter [Prolixibacteraceae bacterium]|nr:MAG: magnesium transporter [Bacteroidetes bacterium GWB2_41_8]HCY43489.1 magnesium transporter [Prolixibacteraceae bacterium]
MKIELNRDFIDQLKELIEQKADQDIIQIISELHAADIAEIMEELDSDEAQYLFLLLDGELASDVLLEIPEADQRRFLRGLPPDVIAHRFIEFMESDDAADVMADLDEDVQDEVLQHIDDKEQAGDIADLLEYDEDTAGGIMAKELVAVNENWTVQTCLKEISIQAEDIDEIYYVYVVDDNFFLKGVLSLKMLIMKPTHTVIKSMVTEDAHFVRTDASQEEVAQVMEKYDLVALPVVDQIGRLKGRITIDDVLDIIREEADKDYQMASGISGDVEAGDNVFQRAWTRIPWLFIGMIGGIIGAGVLGSHSSQLQQIPAMAFFIPLIAAMAGNVGVQSSSIIVQSIASGTRSFDSVGRKLVKELSVAFSTALLFSVLIFMYNFFFTGNMRLTYSVSITLFIVMVFASLFGTLIPLVLNKLKIDPAVATGPFITTTNDILGLLIYMTVAQMFFKIL